jgi:CRP-like cAMP-binding protein
MAMTAATLNSGDSFGFSALFKEGIYTANAVCADQCDLIVFQGETLMDLLENNHSMGFFIMRNLAQIFGQRLKRRSEQFVRAVLTHPEIHNLEG